MPKWERDGPEPDYRFSLANERTFLAWLRTSLSLLAGSIALVQLVPAFSIPGSRTVLAALLALAGTLLPALAYRRWARMQRAMRTGQPLPLGSALSRVATATVVIGLVICLLVVTAHHPA